MPTYAYRCTSCAHEFDVFQRFSDSPLTECPECGASIRKVFQPVGIVFKGSGWYINDSRKSTPDGDAPAKGKDEASKPDVKKEPAPAADAKPAAKAAESAAPAAAKVAAD